MRKRGEEEERSNQTDSEFVANVFLMRPCNGKRMRKKKVAMNHVDRQNPVANSKCEHTEKYV